MANDDRPLADRTRELIERFERADKGYAFNDGGEGTTYAEDFADLLREWLAAHEADGEPTGAPSDEDRIRDAMAEATDHPGRVVTAPAGGSAQPSWADYRGRAVFG